MGLFSEVPILLDLVHLGKALQKRGLWALDSPVRAEAGRETQRSWLGIVLGKLAWW
jgi:hypothetical protein